MGSKKEIRARDQGNTDELEEQERRADRHRAAGPRRHGQCRRHGHCAGAAAAGRLLEHRMSICVKPNIGAGRQQKQEKASRENKQKPKRREGKAHRDERRWQGACGQPCSYAPPTRTTCKRGGRGWMGSGEHNGATRGAQSRDAKWRQNASTLRMNKKRRRKRIRVRKARVGKA